MENQIDNPKGLHARYYIQKIKVVDNPEYDKGSILGLQPDSILQLQPVDDGAEYFVLRLDMGGSDIEHIKACRIGVRAYAEAIKHNLPELSKDILEKYPEI